MTAAPSHLSSGLESLRQVLGAFYKTVDVMKSAYNSEDKLMNVWADDLKAIEDVMSFLEQIRDASPTPQIAGGVRELEAVRQKMERLKETECRHSGQMEEALLYGLHGAVKRYLAALSPQAQAGETRSSGDENGCARKCVEAKDSAGSGIDRNCEDTTQGDRPAATVKVPSPERTFDIAQASPDRDLPTLDEYRNNLIEECAQVAEKYWAREVASQIRALSIPSTDREGNSRG